MRIASLATLYTTSGYVMRCIVQKFCTCTWSIYCRVQNFCRCTWSIYCRVLLYMSVAKIRWKIQVPDRYVQSVVSLKNRSVGLSCGFPLGAGNGTWQTNKYTSQGWDEKSSSSIFVHVHFERCDASIAWKCPSKIRKTWDLLTMVV